MARRDAPAPSSVERVGWSDFLAAHFRWRQGEHVSLVGPTGGGKTTLALELLPMRSHVMVLATKPRDRTFAALRRQGYVVSRAWPPPPNANRVVLWPEMRRMEDTHVQQRVFANALGSIYTEGAWCVYADELRYLCETLKLTRFFEQLWQQGRSLGISLVAGTQRPAHVPVFLYDQATHLFFWRDNDDANLKRIGGIGWLDSRTVRETVAGLAKHDVLYVNTRDGKLLVTRVERPR